MSTEKEKATGMKDGGEKSVEAVSHKSVEETWGSKGRIYGNKRKG